MAGYEAASQALLGRQPFPDQRVRTVQAEAIYSARVLTHGHRNPLINTEPYNAF